MTTGSLEAPSLAAVAELFAAAASDDHKLAGLLLLPQVLRDSHGADETLAVCDRIPWSFVRRLLAADPNDSDNLAAVAAAIHVWSSFCGSPALAAHPQLVLCVIPVALAARRLADARSKATPQSSDNNETESLIRIAAEGLLIQAQASHLAAAAMIGTCIPHIAHAAASPSLDRSDALALVHLAQYLIQTAKSGHFNESFSTITSDTDILTAAVNAIRHPNPPATTSDLVMHITNATATAAFKATTETKLDLMRITTLSLMIIPNLIPHRSDTARNIKSLLRQVFRNKLNRDFRAIALSMVSTIVSLTDGLIFDFDSDTSSVSEPPSSMEDRDLIPDSPDMLSHEQFLCIVAHAAAAEIRVTVDELGRMSAAWESSSSSSTSPTKHSDDASLSMPPASAHLMSISTCDAIIEAILLFINQDKPDKMSESSVKSIFTAISDMVHAVFDFLIDQQTLVGDMTRRDHNGDINPTLSATFCCVRMYGFWDDAGIASSTDRSLDKIIPLVIHATKLGLRITKSDNGSLDHPYTRYDGNPIDELSRVYMHIAQGSRDARIAFAENGCVVNLLDFILINISTMDSPAHLQLMEHLVQCVLDMIIIGPSEPIITHTFLQTIHRVCDTLEQFKLSPVLFATSCCLVCVTYSIITRSGSHISKPLIMTDSTVSMIATMIVKESDGPLVHTTVSAIQALTTCIDRVDLSRVSCRLLSVCCRHVLWCGCVSVRLRCVLEDLVRVVDRLSCR